MKYTDSLRLTKQDLINAIGGDMKAYSDPFYPREYEIQDKPEFRQEEDLYWEFYDRLKEIDLPISNKVSVLSALADDIADEIKKEDV